MTDADLAQRYARTVQAVEAVLAQADIEGLIADGAPANEYSPEAPELARLILRDNLNEQTLKDFWLARFGPSCLLFSGNSSVKAHDCSSTCLRRQLGTRDPEVLIALVLAHAAGAVHGIATIAASTSA